MGQAPLRLALGSIKVKLTQWQLNGNCSHGQGPTKVITNYKCQDQLALGSIWLSLAYHVCQGAIGKTVLTSDRFTWPVIALHNVLPGYLSPLSTVCLNKPDLLCVYVYVCGRKVFVWVYMFSDKSVEVTGIHTLWLWGVSKLLIKQRID